MPFFIHRYPNQNTIHKNLSPNLSPFFLIVLQFIPVNGIVTGELSWAMLGDSQSQRRRGRRGGIWVWGDESCVGQLSTGGVESLKVGLPHGDFWFAMMMARYAFLIFSGKPETAEFHFTSVGSLQKTAFQRLTQSSRLVIESPVLGFHVAKSFSFSLNYGSRFVARKMSA